MELDVGNSAYLDDDAAGLVAGCLGGDQRAWRRLVDRFSPLVWTIARSHRLSQADCQDAYQLTWMRVVQHLDKLRDPARIAEWISIASRRECLKQIERNKKHVPVGDSTVLDVMPRHVDLPDDVVARRAAAGEVLAAFRKLPERDRAILGVLMADPAPSYDEASRMLGMPRGSIGPLRARALARLRTLLPVATP